MSGFTSVLVGVTGRGRETTEEDRVPGRGGVTLGLSPYETPFPSSDTLVFYFYVGIEE